MSRSLSDLLFFIGSRALQTVPVIIGVVTLAFLFTHLLPNPCGYLVGSKGGKTAYLGCIAYLGLNKPLEVQYFAYWQTFLTGGWGFDTISHLPVLQTILHYFPATVELVLAAAFLMIFIGIPLGVVAAASNNRIGDHLVRIFYLSGWATPTYLAAIILDIGVGSQLGLLGGAFRTINPPFAQPTNMSVLDALIYGFRSGDFSWTGDAIVHLILPAAALAFINMGIATRMTRSTMLEVLPLDVVKTARMKGLGEFWVLYKHALRNALITTTTVLGFTVGTMVSATVVIEEIFTWPGIGSYAFSSITAFDISGEIGVAIFFAIAVVVANLLSDILYGVLDPRVEWR
jgi:peptide/nickel transport system permease protein